MFSTCRRKRPYLMSEGGAPISEPRAGDRDAHFVEHSRDNIHVDGAGQHNGRHGPARQRRAREQARGIDVLTECLSFKRLRAASNVSLQRASKFENAMAHDARHPARHRATIGKHGATDAAVPRSKSIKPRGCRGIGSPSDVAGFLRAANIQMWAGMCFAPIQRRSAARGVTPVGSKLQAGS